MKSSSTLTQTVAPPAPHRRQSTRQIRTSTMRPTNYYARSFSGRGTALGAAKDDGPQTTSAPGFCPALTHFTDSITALPKEMIRHFSMLKEVEAKIYAPVEELTALIDDVAKLPVPPRNAHQNHPRISHPNMVNIGLGVGLPGPVDAQAGLHNPQQGAVASEAAARAYQIDEEADLERRRRFFQLRLLLHDTSMILDEKNAVLSSANQTLSRQLARMNSSFVHLGSEISDEARFGSATHWAYADKESKKTNGTNERTRREVAAANNLAAAAAAVHEGDIAATRSEARREAMLANKRNRAKQVDSDFDDAPALPRKGQNNPRAKKGAETGTAADPKNAGLGIISNGQPNKRRKTEKGPATATATKMERSISGNLNVPPNGRAALASSRNTPAADAGKKRAKPPIASSSSVPKKRMGPGGAQSPLSASSPLQGTFTREFSPASERPQSSRTRQDSASNLTLAGPQDKLRTQPALTSSAKHTNGIGSRTPEVKVVEESIQVAAQEAGTSIKESREGAQGDGKIVAEDAPVAAVGRGTPVPTKDISPPAATANGEGLREVEVPLPTSLGTRSGRASKTATPVVSSFPDLPPSRPRRTNSNHSKINADHNASPFEPPSQAQAPAPKRSHKKGAGPLAQAALRRDSLQNAGSGALSNNHRGAEANDYSDAPGSGMPSDVEGVGDDDDDDDDEPRYCYCNGVSYGEMVACDNKDCPREWFHLQCAGLTRPPGSKTKWYCNQCKENLKTARPGSRH